jgi:hypothetical protein
MSVLAVGYEQGGRIFHLLPPRPPLSLDVIYLCDDEALRRFTSAGHFGYLRHILRAQDLPIGDCWPLTQQAQTAHLFGRIPGGRGQVSGDYHTVKRRLSISGGSVGGVERRVRELTLSTIGLSCKRQVSPD